MTEAMMRLIRWCALHPAEWAIREVRPTVPGHLHLRVRITIFRAGEPPYDIQHQVSFSRRELDDFGYLPESMIAARLLPATEQVIREAERYLASLEEPPGTRMGGCTPTRGADIT